MGLVEMGRTPPPALTPYDQLAVRVHRQAMGAPGVREKHVHVERRDARDQDWDQLLEAISEMEGVIIAHRDDGSVDLFWKVSYDDF